MCLASLGGAARPSGGLRPCPANRAAHGTGPSPRRCLPPSGAPAQTLNPQARAEEPAGVRGYPRDSLRVRDAAGVPRSALALQRAGPPSLHPALACRSCLAGSCASKTALLLFIPTTP